MRNVRTGHLRKRRSCERLVYTADGDRACHITPPLFFSQKKKRVSSCACAVRFTMFPLFDSLSCVRFRIQPAVAIIFFLGAVAGQPPPWVGQPKNQQTTTNNCKYPVCRSSPTTRLLYVASALPRAVLYLPYTFGVSSQRTPSWAEAKLWHW